MQKTPPHRAQVGCSGQLVAVSCPIRTSAARTQPNLRNPALRGESLGGKVTRRDRTTIQPRRMDAHFRHARPVRCGCNAAGYGGVRRRRNASAASPQSGETRGHAQAGAGYRALTAHRVTHDVVHDSPRGIRISKSRIADVTRNSLAETMRGRILRSRIYSPSGRDSLLGKLAGWPRLSTHSHRRPPNDGKYRLG
jgi:hypothetical protein